MRLLFYGSKEMAVFGRGGKSEGTNMAGILSPTGLFEIRAQEYLETLPIGEHSGVNRFLKGLGKAHLSPSLASGPWSLSQFPPLGQVLDDAEPCSGTSMVTPCSNLAPEEKQKARDPSLLSGPLGCPALFLHCCLPHAFFFSSFI